MFVVLFMPPLNVLTGYFYVSLNLVADPTVLNSDTFRDTVPFLSRIVLIGSECSPVNKIFW